MFKAPYVFSILIAIGLVSVAYGTYIEVKAGKDLGIVYLKTGTIDLAYEFNTHPNNGNEERAPQGNSLTLIVTDSNGTVLFRNSIDGVTGWYHATFFNAFDGYVHIWAKGHHSQVGMGDFELNQNTTITGGDAPPAGVVDSGTTTPGTGSSAGTPTTPPPPTAAATPRPPEIHAVIISGQSDPSKILRGNVHLVGGLIALGRQPGVPGTWDPGVTITPDAELVTGQKVPPITPNLFDVRITRYEISATLEAPSATGP